jgi:predicted Zn-dependent protease
MEVSMLTFARPFLLTSCLVGSTLLAAGCETNPVTGRSQVLLVSEQQAQEASTQAYAKTVSQARAQRKLEVNTARAARVQRITERLVAQASRIVPESAGWNWEMSVIQDSNINAWAMPGGKMAVYTGLIERINPSDDELAQVIGHEISHALLQHGRERMSRAMATNAALALGSIATGVNLSGLENVAMVATQLPNSRTAETEADRIGLEIAARAGYNPNAAISLWQKMSRASGGAGGPEWLSTHPSDETRIANLQAMVPKVMPFFVAASR